ncbi:MAG: thiamine phosphate synthase [Alphaproteobacteria bacterium]|nr:thiamine phosphate synthase [Alphaproteobacteria bacterium]
MTKFNPFVYFILDPTLCNGRDVADIAAAALRGRAGMLQYRDKDNPLEMVLENALRIQSVVGGRIPFLINDHVTIARDINADGVHIGQGDMTPAQARALLGPEKIIGLTAFTEDHIRAVDPAIVAYIGTGPVYPTQTDKGKPVLGVARFSELAALSPVPVVGIGGITADNAAPVIRAGAAGVAVMRGISQALDPEFATQELVRAISLS